MPGIASAAKRHKLTWTERNQRSNRFRRLTAHCRLMPGSECRAEWDGQLPLDGSDLFIREGRYHRPARWMAWEAVPGRPKCRAGDVVTPSCGNPRCLTPKHMVRTPAPSKPKT